MSGSKSPFFPAIICHFKRAETAALTTELIFYREIWGQTG
jgi:hypothetical protein